MGNVVLTVIQPPRPMTKIRKTCLQNRVPEKNFDHPTSSYLPDRALGPNAKSSDVASWGQFHEVHLFNIHECDSCKEIQIKLKTDNDRVVLLERSRT